MDILNRRYPQNLWITLLQNDFEAVGFHKTSNVSLNRIRIGQWATFNFQLSKKQAGVTASDCQMKIVIPTNDPD